MKNNDSLQGRYKIINNQAVVLLVSYFGSAVEDLFKIGVDSRLTLDPDHSALMDEELKLSFSDIRTRGWDLKAIAADLLVDKKDLKFQDMKSIADVFRSYLGITIKRDQTVNNIITAQACRHVIVHAGNEVTTKMMHQLRDASPRDLKAQITVGEIVEFSPEEVALVAASMQTYISNLCAGLKGRV